MRCQNCDFENREGVNFCEECGEKLIIAPPGLCPSCGFENRDGVNFCEECGTKLGMEAPVPARKKPAAKKAKPALEPEAKTKRKPRTKPKPDPQPEVQPTPDPQPQKENAQAPPQTVVVQVQQEEKRRFNPLWLAVLLLLLVISCGCLMMYDVVVPPASVAAAVDPIMDTVRGRIPPEIDQVIHGIAEAINTARVGNAGAANQAPGGKGANDKEEEKIAGGGLAGCDIQQVETCWAMGGTVKQNPFNFEFEEFCVCEGMEFDQKWCEGEGGWWNDAFEMCSFVNACYDLRSDQHEIAEARGWFGGHCNNFAENKNGDLIQYCSCPNLDKLPDSCGEINETIHTISNINCVEGDVTCTVSFSQQRGFPSDEIRLEGSQKPVQVGDDAQWSGIIKFDNGKTIDLHDCQRNSFSTEIECAGFDFDRDNEGAGSGKVYLCRGYCCVFAGEEDRTDLAPARFLTAQCPTASDLRIENFRYEKGVILFDVINDPGWQVDTVEGQLIDGLDRAWSDVSCEQEPENKNMISCRGAGTVKTGKASIAFSPGTLGDGCNSTVEVSFPLPEYSFCPAGQSLCAGTCCSEGHCCTCNGKLGCWQSCSGCD